MWGRIVGWCLVIWLMGASPAFSEQDVERGRDNPYLLRLPNFHILESGDRTWGPYRFCDGERVIEMQGRLYRNLYRLRPGVNIPSVSQIRREHSKAIQRLGGQVLFEGRCGELEGLGDPRAWDVILVGKAIGSQGELWIEVWPYEKENRLYYSLTVLEGKGP
jgi:hypothetical protein